MNVTIIRGNLTRDPEMRYMPRGAAVSQFGIGVNRRWRTESGEQKEESSFFDCEAFGKVAESLTQHFHKGDEILLEGRLKQDRWKDKTTGAERSKSVIVIERWYFCGGKRDTAPETAAPLKPALVPASKEPAEDDVPF